MADLAGGVVRFEQGGVPHAVLRRYDDFGIDALDLVAPPSRFWSDGAGAPQPIYVGLDERRATPLPSPAGLLAGLPASEARAGMTRRSIARLHAWFLVSEDPQRRLEAREVVTLAHQASLVQHVLQEPSLARVLIADEVGLGKTIEAALILQELLRRQPGLRVLYLSPARLVANVHREFRRLGLEFRCFVAGQDNTATIGDARVIASIHRAVHPNHFDRFLEEARWDVVVVDECHHLSDWTPGGGSPVRKYKLVSELLKKLRPGGRVILMSGTPHQGHPARFENLVKLLRSGEEETEALAGRVVYRTKEDVRDWEGRPLFPRRQVNSPLVVDLGPEYQAWLGRIHEFFEPGRAADGEGSMRAAGWRAGQALQWATSSVEAGLGYLIRQALRKGWDDAPGVLSAVSAIRPYRGGAPTERPESVLQRMRKEVERQQASADVEDIEETDNGGDGAAGSGWTPDPEVLSELLDDGVALARSAGYTKWELLWDEILSKVGPEKVVMFAQPIETVSALCRFLSLRTADRVAVIVGGQSDEERSREIEAFWDPKGPQFLVSSRAGGEGLNLQVARHLVHLDVPWNPMELEQRVGRVHRFLSRRTVIVDTLVVKESREVDTYRVAREKLHEVASSLVPPERFEELFSRVMSLVPPEELQGLLAERAHGPLSVPERARLTELVTAGFDRWREFDKKYSSRQRQIRELDPGEAGWPDVRAFAVSRLEARPDAGFTALLFELREGEVLEASTAAEVLVVGKDRYACGDHGGMPVTGPTGEKAASLGLNSALLAEALREAAFPSEATGAAVVAWPEDERENRPAPGPFGLLALVRQTVSRAEGSLTEGGVQLRLWLAVPDEPAVELTGEAKARVIRTLVKARSSPSVVLDPELLSRCVTLEAELSQSLRVPSEQERADRLVPVVFPIVACLVR